MKTPFLGRALASAVLTLSLASTPVLAATAPGQGETTGPAAGKTTAPSAATQKQVAKPGSTAGGAPGVTAKPGTESGGNPNSTMANGTSKNY